MRDRELGDFRGISKAILLFGVYIFNIKFVHSLDRYVLSTYYM